VSSNSASFHSVSSQAFVAEWRARTELHGVSCSRRFESRLQRPFRPSSRSREDHRLAKTRQNRALIAPQEPAVPFSFSRSLRTGPLVDSRQFRTPAGHNRPARPDHISGLLTNTLKNQITPAHPSSPRSGGLSWPSRSKRTKNNAKWEIARARGSLVAPGSAVGRWSLY